MESSEEDDEFPSIETITPQSKVNSVFQSPTEKGIRHLCCELLDLKDAVENLCGNTRTKYLAFLRISEEVGNGRGNGRGGGGFAWGVGEDNEAQEG